MVTYERRITPRFKVHTPLSFHRLELLSQGGQRTKAINVSTRGVYFMTNIVLSVGEALEILLEMPKRVTGVKDGIRRFSGRVAHVESKDMPQGLSGVGVQLLYYERDLIAVTID